MDETERSDSDRDLTVKIRTGSNPGEKRDIIIVSSLILFVTLAVFVLLVAGFQIISSINVNSIMASIWPTATPMPTSTPVPTTTPLPNPQFHPGDILYSTTFDSTEGWNVDHIEDEMNTLDRSITNGVYLWNVVAKSGVYNYSRLKKFVSMPFDYYQISVDAHMLNGPSYGNYGIIFDIVDSKNFWVWIMDQDGNGLLQARVDGQWADVSSRFTGPIKKYETNNLTIKISGDLLYFYVNGMLVGSYKNSSPYFGAFTTSTQYGVFVEVDNAGDKATVEFDNFIVSHPNTFSQ